MLAGGEGKNATGKGTRSSSSTITITIIIISYIRIIITITIIIIIVFIIIIIIITIIISITIILHTHHHNIHGPQQYSVFNQLLAICAVDVAAKHQRRRWGGKTAQLEVEWGNQRSKEEEGGMEKGEEGRGEM